MHAEHFRRRLIAVSQPRRASQLADGGLRPDDAKALMQHSSTATNEQVYTHIFNEEAQQERIRSQMRAAQNGGAS